MKEYTKIRQFYAFVGFTVLVAFVCFMIWSLINQNELITLLVKIFG